MTTKKKSRVRTTLLVLLWVWAICVFATLDLFKNVPEFDRVRPDSPLYEGMRVAAHRMIGEPIAEEVGGPAPPSAAEVLKRDLARAHASDDERQLALLARDADPRVRAAALERLGDREELLRVVQDDAETPRMRRSAARLLGRFGTEADLAGLLDAGLPAAVRDGAVLGLGEAGTTWSAEQLLVLAAQGNTAALEGIARLATPSAGAVLRPALLDGAVDGETRVAICRALARIRGDDCARALSDALSDSSNPPAVRAMAANSLGRIADPGATLVVSNATTDPDPQVARQARLAQTRLLHAR